MILPRLMRFTIIINNICIVKYRFIKNPWSVETAFQYLFSFICNTIDVPDNGMGDIEADRLHSTKPVMAGHIVINNDDKTFIMFLYEPALYSWIETIKNKFFSRIRGL